MEKLFVMKVKECMVMIINSLSRHFKEGAKNLIRNGWMSFAAFSAVVVTLAIVGVSLLVALNVQQMSKYVANQLEVSAYLQQNLSNAEGQKIEMQVENIPGVKSVVLETKQQGLKQLETELGPQYGDLLKGLGTNPLPVTLIVKADNPRDTLQVANNLKTIPQIASVNDGAEYVRPLFRVLDIVRNIGAVLLLAMFLTAVFLISNTIRIAIFSRRREIEIMRLVGATNGFIRMPFLVESTLIGVFGGAVPAVALDFLYQYLYQISGGYFYGIHFPLISVNWFVIKVTVALLVLGFVLGFWGGFMSVRKFLRI
ncbi:ABC transporter permease [Alicyclobacillus sp. TC]|nr:MULTISPECIES: permease-like cell division protein FtsX [Alicyclobacillus]QRF22647.1 ABC transporter permease [Alicyclobacillus sp. TC]